MKQIHAFILAGLAAAAVNAPISGVYAQETSIPFLAEDVGSQPAGVACRNKRGAVNYLTKSKLKKNGKEVVKHKDNWAADSVLWCPPEYPNIVHCGSIDDFAPKEGPTPFSGKCLEDGACDASEKYDVKKKDNNGSDEEDVKENTISREGPQNRYHEFIVKEQNGKAVEGCWGYDRGGKHRPYRLEILCCSFPRVD